MTRTLKIQETTASNETNECIQLAKGRDRGRGRGKSGKIVVTEPIFTETDIIPAKKGRRRCCGAVKMMVSESGRADSNETNEIEGGISTSHNKGHEKGKQDIRPNLSLTVSTTLTRSRSPDDYDNNTNVSIILMMTIAPLQYINSKICYNQQTAKKRQKQLGIFVKMERKSMQYEETTIFTRVMKKLQQVLTRILSLLDETCLNTPLDLYPVNMATANAQPTKSASQEENTLARLCHVEKKRLFSGVGRLLMKLLKVFQELKENWSRKDYIFQEVVEGVTKILKRH
ncbi:3781_t:CDS:2 [Funneliformis geosporum]|nr:3781_t:CDS:2 [Funneliformis geosporum]